MKKGSNNLKKKSSSLAKVHLNRVKANELRRSWFIRRALAQFPKKLSRLLLAMMFLWHGKRKRSEKSLKRDFERNERKGSVEVKIDRQPFFDRLGLSGYI